MVPSPPPTKALPLHSITSGSYTKEGNVPPTEQSEAIKRDRSAAEHGDAGGQA